MITTSKGLSGRLRLSVLRLDELGWPRGREDIREVANDRGQEGVGLRCKIPLEVEG